jgi:hypothetical protein
MASQAPRDRKLIIHTAAQAQRACDYILNVNAG